MTDENDEPATIDIAHLVLAGTGPIREIDRERASRLVIASLEGDDDEKALTLLAILTDDTGLRHVDAILNVLGVLANKAAEHAAEMHGPEKAVILYRKWLVDSLKAQL